MHRIVFTAWPSTRKKENLISVLQLDRLDYATGLRLQQRLVKLRKENSIGDVLLLLEHSPVITLGRNAKSANITASAEVLASRGVEVFECDRGGDVTFHGPGQLVGYPIFDLRAFPSNEVSRSTLGVIEYVRRLEEVLIRTCAEFGIVTERVAGLTGVWTDPSTLENQPSSELAVSQQSHPQAKIAAIGVHISRAITSHGFALNVSTDLSFFDLIVPCGIHSKSVTSMQKELNKILEPEKIAHSIARNFGTIFQSQILWLDSLDSLLGHAQGIPMKVPEDLRRLRGEEDTFFA
ncbi:MAG: lipoyl(octanoyl) transferase LipB [Acidobacteriaceae bacterium]